jgi:hypothetical protein
LTLPCWRASVPGVTKERIVLVGGPRSGKSTLARELRAQHIPTYCGDPLSAVKEPEDLVTYLPEGLPISGDDGAAQWIADNWFTMPGPWCCEGWVMARALRRWLAGNTRDGIGRGSSGMSPCDRIVVFQRQHAHAVTKPGQVAMAKAVATVWAQIAHHFAGITEYR